MKFFVNELFKGKGDNEKIVVLRKQNGFIPQFVDSAEEIKTYDKDMYVSCCTMRNGINKGRGKKEDVNSVFAVWADIDFAVEGHAKPGLPSQEQVDEILNRYPIPTFTVKSGGGYHLWYCLKEKVKASQEVEKFIESFQAGLRRHFTVDATHNLDRILRLPGTNNYKRKHPFKVSYTHCDVRYTFDELSEYCYIENSQPHRFDRSDRTIDNSSQEASILLTNDTLENRTIDNHCQEASILLTNDVIGNILLTNDVIGIDLLNKFNDLCDKNKRVKDVFDHSITVGDGSPSAYDFSLSIMLLREGFNSDEISRIIIESRKIAKCVDTKIYRKDYLKRTIDRAYKIIEKEEKKMIKDEEGFELSGIKFFRLIKYLGDTPSYEIVTNKGQIKVENIEDILSLTRLRKLVVEQLDILITDIVKSKDYLPIISDLVENPLIVEVAEEATEEGHIKILLNQWIEERGVVEEYEEPCEIFLNGSSKYFKIEGLRRYMDTVANYKITTKKLATVLVKIGYKALSIRIKDKTVRCWK